MAETPAVDLPEIAAWIEAYAPTHDRYGYVYSTRIKPAAEALLGMVDTLTAQADEWRKHALVETSRAAKATVANIELRERLAGTSPTPPGSFDNLAGGIASDTATDGKFTESPTRDLVALADRWDADASRRIEKMGPERTSYMSARYEGVADTLESCARELRAALGVPRTAPINQDAPVVDASDGGSTAGHKEDPVRTATPGTRCRRVEHPEAPESGINVWCSTHAQPWTWCPAAEVGGAPTTEPDDVFDPNFVLPLVPIRTRRFRMTEITDEPADPDTTGGDDG